MGRHSINFLESRDTDSKSQGGQSNDGRAAQRLRRVAEGGTTTTSARGEVSDVAASPVPLPVWDGIDSASSAERRRRDVSRIALGLIAMTLIGSAIGVPTPLAGDVESYDKEIDVVGFREDPFVIEAEEEDEEVSHRLGDRLNDREVEEIRKSIIQSLGINRIPDPSKANVSQAEYERAHGEYLRRLEQSQGQWGRRRKRLHTLHATEHLGSTSRGSVAEAEKPYALHFPLEKLNETNPLVEHAALRLLLQSDHDSPSEDPDHLDVLVYQPIGNNTSRRLVAERRVSLGARESRWIELDSTEAAVSWLEDGRENLGLQLELKQRGVRVRRSIHSPALHVFTDGVATPGRRRRRAIPEQMMSLHKGRRTECRGDNKKCCRHEMTVIFKDLKGFEFIIQPKTFDAGYCKGRCPPRFNPAHHHALIQSLIWKEDKRKAPRPCCAPSKLTELEILYFDENDSSKLTVSNWKNMKVLECACS